jgi:hypothetical protein
MFSKRTLVSGLVAFVAMFLFSWLMWGFIFSSTWENMSDVVMTMEPNMLYLTLSYLVIAWVMAFIFPFGYEGGSAVKEGFRFGLVIWALLSLGMGLGMQAFQPDNMGAFLFAQVISLLQYALGGIVIGMVAARMGDAALAAAAPEPMAAVPEPPPPEPQAEGGEDEPSAGAAF